MPITWTPGTDNERTPPAPTWTSPLPNFPGWNVMIHEVAAGDWAWSVIDANGFPADFHYGFESADAAKQAAESRFNG